jgi:hypothetical protein
MSGLSNGLETRNSKVQDHSVPVPVTITGTTSNPNIKANVAAMFR